MEPGESFLGRPNQRIGLLALCVIALDQATKAIVLQLLGYEQEKMVVTGFFKFVHWHNTGAAWNLFQGNNGLLVIVAVVALVLLFLNRRHFYSHTLTGQIAFGLIFGGIIGNLIDRVWRKHVVDFIYFFMQTGSGREVGFPAFNVADSAICTGVGLIFLMTWRSERATKKMAKSAELKPQMDANRHP